MDYAAQQRYFARSRLLGVTAVAAALAIALTVVRYWWPGPGARVLLAYMLFCIATAASLYYTPDYLHLTVRPDKSRHWAVKIRWRIAVSLFIIGVLLQPSFLSRLEIVIAALLVGTVNFAAARFVPKRIALFYWIADLTTIGVFRWCFDGGIVLFAAISAALHFAVLVSRTKVLVVALLFTVGTFLFLVVAFPEMLFGPIGIPDEFLVARAGVFVLAAGPLCAAVATFFLVARARAHCLNTVSVALDEITAFTAYFPDRICHLWATADKQLAQNWESSGVANKSREEIAEWYRQNSELYMFAISAYNLEYKRIKSNLKMLTYAHGSALDYGAGNGELILELARCGHRAAYYDVDGVSKRFAQFRAAKYGLNVEFASTKDELRRIAAIQPFDTIFSFDVLEHIPDLPAELDFLISLLAPNGLLLFDVPAGATVSHPMHLNHTLNIREHLLARGMKEIPMRSWRLGKQEKYTFRLASRPTK